VTTDIVLCITFQGSHQVTAQVPAEVHSSLYMWFIEKKLSFNELTCRCPWLKMPCHESLINFQELCYFVSRRISIHGARLTSGRGQERTHHNTRSLQLSSSSRGNSVLPVTERPATRAFLTLVGHDFIRLNTDYFVPRCDVNGGGKTAKMSALNEAPCEKNAWSSVSTDISPRD
jgi:hypothetical protein